LRLIEGRDINAIHAANFMEKVGFRQILHLAFYIFLYELRQMILAIADHDEIKKRCQGLQITSDRASGDNKRIVFTAIFRVERYPG
jgi:ABC-type nickel/cobalt efflux system permease component RcnA